MTEEKFLQDAQLWVFKNHKTQTAAAEALGISKAYLSDQLKGDKPGSKHLLDAMGYEVSKDTVVTLTYTKKG